MSSTTTSLALKPWARDGREDTPLGEVLARVNHERGQYFRDLTEAALQEEIAAGRDLSLSESDDEDAEEDEDVRIGAKEAKQPTNRQELFAARQEVLQRVSEAQQDILLSLDMISLLETKHNPNAAGVTVSAVLKQSVPTGSLGTDVWRDMPVDKAREAQDILMANNVRMKYLQESADDLLAAASRLQDNVRKETRFWDEILSVSERGWNISRLPGQRQKLLGVHFGFNGSAPEFARRDLAALLTDAEGDIKLERGIGTRPKAVRAVVRKDGKIIGASRLPSLLDSAETTLEARIRHARDSVYDEELYHEMIREARTLTSMGVSIRGPDVSFAISEDKSALQVSFHLVALDDDTSLPLDATSEFDHDAQAALLTSRLLLGQAHRQKLQTRTRLPPPLVEKKDHEEILSILRPLILVIKHHLWTIRLNDYVSKVHNVLQKAQVGVSSQHAHASLPITKDDTLDTASLIGSLLRTLIAEATIKLDESSPGLKLAIITSGNISLGSSFHITSPSEPRFELSHMEDMTTAADEYLATALVQDLHGKVRAGWKFDARGGYLFKNQLDDAREVVRILLDGWKSSLQLFYSKGAERKRVDWTLEGDEQRSLGDVLESLVK